MHHLFATAAAQPGSVQLAALGTTNMVNWLKDNALPLAMIATAVFIISRAHKRDIAGTVTIVAIVLIGLGVVGAATNTFGLGTQIAGLFGANT